MWKLLRKVFITVGVIILLLSSGCDGYVKTNYAPDAAFVLEDSCKTIKQ